MTRSGASMRTIPTRGCSRGPSCPRSITSRPRTSASAHRTCGWRTSRRTGSLWNGAGPDDLTAAARIVRRHKDLRIGLVDAVVIAVAERLRASAIATLDLKHFGAIAIKGRPLLLPRDA